MASFYPLNGQMARLCANKSDERSIETDERSFQYANSINARHPGENRDPVRRRIPVNGPGCIISLDTGLRPLLSGKTWIRHSGRA